MPENWFGYALLSRPRDTLAIYIVEPLMYLMLISQSGSKCHIRAFR